MKSASEQKAEIDRLLAKYDSKIAAAFQEAIRVITDSVTLEAIAAKLRVGDKIGAINLFTDALIAAGFTGFARTLTDALIAGGDFGQKIANSNRIVFGFNIAESNTARFMDNYIAERIKQISREMRVTISQVVYREVSAGTNPIDTARKIKQGLGLTASQERTVQNYRRMLENLETDALARRLRDARYDPSIARAIREGKPLTKPKIEAMVQAYTRRYIKRRAETIARTESMTMINSGNQKYWDQMVKSGVVRPRDIRRDWKHSHDSKVRNSHIAIPALNKDGRGLNDPFRSPLGLIRYPGDPQASAGNRINCRCYLFIRIRSDDL